MALSHSALERVDEVFRSIDRSIWVVTAAAGKLRGGLVATWVAQLSLDPTQPRALVALAPNHFTAELLLAGQSCALHLLAAEHIEHVWRFALGTGRDHDKLTGVSFRSGETGSPILTDCLAWLDCRVLTHYDAGDRLFFWVDVVAGERLGDAAPLTERQVMAAANAEQKRHLKQDMDRDVAYLRPLAAAWRRQWLD